jgi:class 3 adenylate cyclase/tetratricopeptide (TPR) repeat protein
MASWTCQQCKGVNPDQTRFCGHCGAPVPSAETTAPTPPPSSRLEWSSPLRSFVSTQVAERLEESHGQIDDERRLVTAVFADISGFTALAERFDPEELSEVIDPVVAALSAVVAKYEGYVEKFAGDAILALFGAPVSHEDDAQRALRAALEMHAELLRARETVPYEHDLGLHVGVNSGHGIARVIGTDARTDYAVLGDSVILAQRLESAAPTGETYVGDSTYRLTKHRFEFEWVEELTLKGKAEPVPTWRLVRELHEEGTDAERAGEISSRLIGRQQEMKTAIAALDKLARGHGGLLEIVGEAGVGKTRLMRHIAGEAQRRRARWMETRCLAHGHGLTYAPLAQVVRDFASIDFDQPPERAAGALKAALSRIDADETHPYLARLLGLPSVEDTTDVARMEPETFKRALHQAFASWLLRLSAAEPLVITIEDCHWMDPSSVALMQDLLAGPAGERLLFCLTSRVDGADVLRKINGSWQHSPETIELGPLDDAAVDDLLQDLLDGLPPRQFRERVVSRTGGNAYFVIELVRSLLDDGALTRDEHGWRVRSGWEREVPPNLEGVLSARIDLLPRAARQSLLEASVIGRRVPLPLLQAMSDHATSGLPVLIDRGFMDVQESGAELVFHHALVQEAAYGRLLRRQRRAGHARLTGLIEELYGAGDDVIDTLARHSYLGDVGPRAIGYLTRAGERAARLFANEQAILHLSRALERARSDPQESAHVRDLLLSLGDLYELTGSYDQALALYSEATSTGNDVRAWRGVVSVLRRQGRYREAERALADAFETARPDDTAALWLEQAWTLAVEGRAEETVLAAAAGLGTAAEEDPLRGYLLLQLAHSEMSQGDQASALTHILEARRLLEHHGDQRGLASVLRLTSGIYLELHDLDGAAVALREGLALAERSGNVEELAGCLVNLGMVEHQRGNMEEAIACDRRAIEEFERIGHGAGRAIAHSNLSEKLMDQGDLDAALQTSLKAYELAHAIKHAPTIADALQTMATIHLKQGSYLMSAERAEEAVRVNLEVGARRYAAEAAEIASRAWLLAGRKSQSRRARLQALELSR